jgi:CheY-like chemotaxis protein
MNPSFSSIASISQAGLRTGSTLTVLLVENDKNEALFLNRSLSRTGWVNFIHNVQDGEEAVRYLQGLEKYADRHLYPVPDVILTDLKMSGMGGMGVLKWLKSHPQFFVIPIIVLTDSQSPSDIQNAYALGANAYMVKPTNPDEFEEMVRNTLEYWASCRTPRPMTD